MNPCQLAEKEVTLKYTSCEVSSRRIIWTWKSCNNVQSLDRTLKATPEKARALA